MHAPSNSIPATRDWANAWLETSSTACEQSLATIRAIQSANAGGGAVVMSLDSTVRLSLLAIVPISPVRKPAAWRILAISQHVLVLPLVPVTPITFSFLLGSP